MSSVAVTLTNRDAWKEAFPMDETKRAVEFLVKTWNEVVPAKSRSFLPTKRENQHTELFWVYLKKLSGSQTRLTGLWIHEHPIVFSDNADTEEPSITKRIRKDITYFSNLNGQQLLLIFEFKKLRETKSSWKTYHGEEGMGRFVNGHYAIGQPIAFMVGMVIGNKTECITGLKQSILSPKTLPNLRMVTRKSNEYILAPSPNFPGLAAFDTEHNRPKDKAASHGTILLSHLFLDLPSVS